MTRAQRRLNALFVANDLPPPLGTIESGSLTLLLNVVRQSDALTYMVSKTLATRDGKGLVMLNVPRPYIVARSRHRDAPEWLAVAGGPAHHRRV